MKFLLRHKKYFFFCVKSMFSGQNTKQSQGRFACLVVESGGEFLINYFIYSKTSFSFMGKYNENGIRRFCLFEKATRRFFPWKKVFISCLRRQVIKYNDKVGPEILSLTRRQAPKHLRESRNLTMRAIVTEKK
jgi:hypothetical protein